MSRSPGTAQRFADRAGGPTLYEGAGYQTGVALLQPLGLLARQQQSPLVALSLRCEPRTHVPGGQLGYDVGVVTPEQQRTIEVKASPTPAEVVELIARLPSAVDSGQVLQLVHGK